MSKYLTPSQQEIRLLLNEADEISKRSDVSKRDESRLSFLFAKAKALQSGHVEAAGEETRQFFNDLFKNKETRQMQAGTQSITYSQTQLGGTLVPNEFYDKLVVGMAQFDPLLNADIVTLIPSGDGALRPFTIPGWDLTTFEAEIVAEGSQQTVQTPPAVASKILNGYKFMATLPVSIELEEDAFDAMASLMQTAYSIGFGRGVGKRLITGNGTTAPQGVLAGAGASVYTTANTGILVLNDFEAVYFKVDRAHRASPKCAWLMNDAAYQMARKATDTVGNPLLKLIGDTETIMGKPVHVAPSLPLYNPSLGTQADGSFCVFGDFAKYFVRTSKMTLTRKWQLPGYVEFGLALYTGIMRVDAKVFDPSNGTVPPIVCASLKA
jgi:HK97 family phage major capsid protein